MDAGQTASMHLIIKHVKQMSYEKQKVSVQWKFM